MSVLDLVKIDVLSDKCIVQKFDSEFQWELRLGSLLVVNPGQEAVFVKGGIALDTFQPGTHTLTTGNIPLLRNCVNWIYGNKTPFTAEVWFVNKTVKRDMCWGTPQRICVLDPKFMFPVNVGAFGRWGFRINDSRAFITQVVGAQLGADSEKISAYFIGEIIEKVSSCISELITQGISIVEISSYLGSLSSRVKAEISSELDLFGIELVNFNIQNINIAPDEMKKIQEIMAKKTEIDILGNTTITPSYVTAKSLDIMKDAANNNGATGAFLAGSVGMGVGVGAGFPLGTHIGHEAKLQSKTGEDSITKLEKLKKMFDLKLITEEEYEKKRIEILSDL